MPILILILFVIGVAEIVLFTALLNFAFRHLVIARRFKIGIISGVATGLAWLMPSEGWLGATLQRGIFKPWDWPFAVAAWLVIAVPVAILLQRNQNK